MYAAPTLTDLGSFQELTLGAGVNAASGGVLGPVGSLVNGTLTDMNKIVSDTLNQAPSFSVDDNSHIGNDGIVIDPSVTVTPR